MELSVKRSSREMRLAMLMAVALWMLYVVIGRGHDYFGAYTWMVMTPWRLPEVAVWSWTLNPVWQNWFMAPFVTMPGETGYLAFTAFTLGAIIYTTKVFGGRPIPVLLSAQMAWVLYWGQLEGWAALGMVLAYVSLQNQKWLVMWLALLLATFKPQAGLAAVVAMWWWLGRERWKAVLALAIVFIITILVWGPWPVWYVQGMILFSSEIKLRASWNASLGYIALPLFIPALLVPLTREKRLIALTATVYLASNYLPFYSTVPLLCFALPWWAYLFGFVGYLVPVIGTAAWNAVVFLPATVLLWIYWPQFQSLYRRWRRVPTAATS